MSDYDKLVARGDVVMDEENLNEVIEQAIQQSVFLSMGRRLRNMTTSELRLKVLSAIPDVYFVGEKGVSKTYPSSALKKTTEVTWKDVDVKAAELAAIVVFPKNVVADGQYDITAETKKQLAAAIAKKVDEAVLFGTQDSDSPSDWPTGIYTGMPAAHVIEYGELGDVYDDLAGIDGVIAQVEEDGYFINGYAAGVNSRALLRGCRDDSGNGTPLFVTLPQSPTQYALDGQPLTFVRNGAWNNNVYLIAGDWSQAVYSIRQDVTFDIFDQGIVQDAQGAISHNLMQEDLVAIRVTFRMGWAMPEPVSPLASGENWYPFSAYVISGEGS